MRVWILIGVAVAAGVGVAARIASHVLMRPEPIIPYLFQDRRMTFAVLPFKAPADDNEGAQVARTITDAASAAEESRPRWAQVASRKSVEQAMAKHAGVKDLATALNVHFLIRGNVTRATSGYNVEIFVVDGATERVLATRSLGAGDGTLTERLREELDNARGFVTYKGFEAEAERAQDRPVEQLDVRDLSFRAAVEWNEKKGQNDEKGAHVSATQLLNRALALSPNDGLALYLTASVNLCDCVEGWSKRVEEQQAIGAEAMEKYLQKNPESPSMLTLKGKLYALQGKIQESLPIVESVLRKSPAHTDAFAVKAYDLLKLDKPREALTALNDILDRRDWQWQELALAAAIHYELDLYERAAQLAQKAKTQMKREELTNPRLGAIGLTLVAAEGRLGRIPRAKAALADFNAAVPGVGTIGAMKKWMHPAADLAGYEPLFDGLRLAGVGD